MPKPDEKQVFFIESEAIKTHHALFSQNVVFLLYNKIHIFQGHAP